MTAREAERHLTTADLAARLGKTIGAIHIMNSRGTGPDRIRVGNTVVYRIADVEAWEASRLVRPARIRRAQAAQSAA